MKIYGHRGSSGYLPENSMVSFEKAIYEDKADGIELDVHYSKDGQIVVLHDFYLDRTTDLTGFVFDKYYNDLADCGLRMPGRDVSTKGIPLLEDVLKMVEKNSKEVYIEFKAGSYLYEGIEERTLEICKKVGLEYEQVLFASFDHEAINRIKSIDKRVKTGALVEARLFDPANYLDHLRADAICSQFALLDRDYVKMIANEGIKVNCYTPNTLWDFNYIKSLEDINIMVTNYPDKAREFFMKNGK